MGAVVLNKRNSLVHLLWTTLMCPMSVQNSGTMYLGLAQNPSATVWHCCVFNSFWPTLELSGTEE